LEEKAVVEKVPVEIEVAYFNLNARRLVLGGVRKGTDGRMVLPRGWLLPDEEPSLAAARILTERTGITTAVHLPQLAGAFVYQGRDEACLTLTYGVLGTRPDADQPRWMESIGVSNSLTRMRQVVRSAEATVAALHTVRALLSVETVAARLAPEVAKNRDGLFRLKELQTVYEAVLGIRVDSANFRRKVEAAEGFVEVVDHEEVMATSRPPAITRGRRPTWYRAGRAERLEPPIRFERK
jgi:8-oxo-dGTP diphosphatase